MKPIALLATCIISMLAIAPAFAHGHGGHHGGRGHAGHGTHAHGGHSHPGWFIIR